MTDAVSDKVSRLTLVSTVGTATADAIRRLSLIGSNANSATLAGLRGAAAAAALSLAASGATLGGARGQVSPLLSLPSHANGLGGARGSEAAGALSNAGKANANLGARGGAARAVMEFAAMHSRGGANGGATVPTLSLTTGVRVSQVAAIFAISTNSTPLQNSPQPPAGSTGGGAGGWAGFVIIPIASVSGGGGGGGGGGPNPFSAPGVPFVSQAINQFALSSTSLKLPLPPCPIPKFPDIAIQPGNLSVSPGRGWSVIRKQKYASLIQTVYSGRETIMYQQTSGIWMFELVYNFMRDATQNQTSYSQYAAKQEFQAISQLFTWCSGMRGSFYFEDRSDNSRKNQAIGNGDGTTTSFTIVRSISSNGLTITEPVGTANQAYMVNVYFNESLQPSGIYTINGNQLVFKIAPANGISITMDFYFYYLCHFTEDQHQYREFMKNLWELGKVRFESLLGSC